MRAKKILGHQRNIQRYCRLLATDLTDLERTSAAECLQQTESLFAENHEPFFNTIGQKRKGSQRAYSVRITPTSGRR
jgi:hypothetical protein